MANRGTHHGAYGDVPQQLVVGDATGVAKPLHPFLDPKRQVTKALPGVHLVHKRILLSDEGRKLTECEAHMRRAHQRQFKDEFIPRMTWEGAKEGYYFTTGFKGTGYYLDDGWCDYNDPDDDGYVLVRVAPAVAVHRVAPKRTKVGKQGLLFDAQLLDALGPAHGKPPHRYKLATPPWLCEMKPPRMRFEKENMMAGDEVKGCNQMTKERLEWLGHRLVQVSEILETRRARKARYAAARVSYASPKSLAIRAPKGAIVRASLGLDSAQVGILKTGTTCVAVEEALNPADGKTSRCRLAAPLRGWISLKTATPLRANDAEFGETQKARKKEKSKARHTWEENPNPYDGARGVSASNPRVVAEFDAPPVTKRKVDVVALAKVADADDPVDDPDDDKETLKKKAAARAIVALPARCGDLAFKGEDLKPVVSQDGPWAILLEFGGADAFDKPLAFVATLKKSTLSKPCKTLLELFAKTHGAKFPGDGAKWAGLAGNADALRLYAVDAAPAARRARRKKLERGEVFPAADAPYCAQDTLVCEFVEDLDATPPSLAAAFVVRRKLGAGAAATALPSARTLELAKRAEERGPLVDDWSSQLDHIKASAKKGWGEPESSEEIREYWDEQKRIGYKHWRTTAALKGFDTRTEDQEKLAKWSKSLKPQAGFLDAPDRKPEYTDEVIAERRKRDRLLGSSETRLRVVGELDEKRREEIQQERYVERQKNLENYRKEQRRLGKGGGVDDAQVQALAKAVEGAVLNIKREKRAEAKAKKEKEYLEYWGKPAPPGFFKELEDEELAGLQNPDAPPGVAG